ncbi:unnamed protein product, partial [Nesidiocoris tenuis]
MQDRFNQGLGRDAWCRACYSGGLGRVPYRVNLGLDCDVWSWTGHWTGLICGT